MVKLHFNYDDYVFYGGRPYKGEIGLIQLLYYYLYQKDK